MFVPSRLDSDAERGATLVEFSLVVPLLLLVMIGIMEFGMGFRDFLTVRNVAQSGARVGAFAGNDAQADCLIVQEVARQLGSLEDRLVEIQIYKADTGTGAQTAAMNTWTLTGDPTDCTVSDPFDGWDHTIAWTATSRNTTYSAGSSLDILGVRVLMSRSWVTGFPPFHGSYTVDEYMLIRLEPEAYA